MDINRKEVSVDAEEEIAVTDLTIDRNGISQRILQDECRGKDERKDSLLKELSKINLMEEDGAYGMDHR